MTAFPKFCLPRVAHIPTMKNAVPFQDDALRLPQLFRAFFDLINPISGAEFWVARGKFSQSLGYAVYYFAQ